MPYKNPEREREAAKQRKARQRAREKSSRLAGTTVDQVAKAPAKGPLTLREWAAEKVEIGRRMCAAGMASVEAWERIARPSRRKKDEEIQVPLIGCRDATALVRLGVDLVNANLELLQPDERENDHLPGHDVELMKDPDFRHFQQQMLIRKAELLSQKASSSI